MKTSNSFGILVLSAAFVLPSYALRGMTTIAPFSNDSFSLENLEEPIEIDISWSYETEEENEGDDDGPSRLIRYKVDGTVVGTSAWEGASGTVQVQLDRIGQYALSVAVCDRAGCSESDSSSITVVDGSNGAADASWNKPTLSAMTAEQAAALTEYATQILEETNDEEERRLKESSPRSRGLGLRGSQSRILQTESLAKWAAKSLGSGILSKVGSTGIDFAFNYFFGVSSDSDKLDEIQDTLTEIQSQIDSIALEIETFNKESEFKATYRKILDNFANIQSVSKQITNIESGDYDKPTEAGLDAWKDSIHNSVTSLKFYMEDSTVGAMPLIMDLYSFQYPTTSGVEVRDSIVEFVDAVRLYLATALISQSWLVEYYPPADANTQDLIGMCTTIGNSAYNMIGAAYPQPYGKPTKFLHRVGTSSALITSSRYTYPDETGKIMKTQTRSEVDTMIKLMTATGSDAWEDTSIEQHMQKNKVNFYFSDPSSVKKEKDSSDCYILTYYYRVYHTNVFIEGNKYKTSKTTDYKSGSCATWCIDSSCASCGTTESAHANSEKDETKEELEKTQFMYYRDDVQINSYGLPALMDAELIAQERDGIQVANQTLTTSTSSSVTRVYLTLETDHGYDYRMIDAISEETLFSFYETTVSGKSVLMSNTLSLDDTDSSSLEAYGAVVLQAGYSRNIGLILRQQVLIQDLNDVADNVQVVIQFA